MFTTNPIVQYENNTYNGDEENLHYHCGDITGHEPFLIATLSCVCKGSVQFRSMLSSDFKFIENTIYNERCYTLEKLQLMHPSNRLFGGWKLHNVALFQTTRISTNTYDEYITEDGTSFKFKTGTLTEAQGLEKSTRINYRDHESKVFFRP